MRLMGLAVLLLGIALMVAAVPVHRAARARRAGGSAPARSSSAWGRGSPVSRALDVLGLLALVTGLVLLIAG